MSAVDAALYKWIVGANERREALDLPPGLIEDSIALLRDALGPDYLDHLLVSGTDAISFFDPDTNPIKKWLKSSMLDEHIVQVLELAAYLRMFKDDPALTDKVDKLKRDRFWPVFFELAMAARMKRACQGLQSVALNRELPDIVGDFTLNVGSMDTPCECSRLGHSPQVNEPFILVESLSRRIADATKKIPLPLIFKIRSTEALTGRTYNVTLTLIRRCLADIKRFRLPTAHHEGPTTVCCGELTPHSERIPFRMIDGVVTNIDGTDWDTAQSLQRIPAADEDEVTERFKAGERFRQFEAVRIFMKFGPMKDSPNYYDRLTNKLRKKLKQTKVQPGHYGKLVLIEIPFDLRKADKTKLKQSIADSVKSSKTTLGVMLAHRERNPHHRHHYSLHGSLNTVGFVLNPDLIPVFRRFRHIDDEIDLITGLPYAVSWDDANAKAQAEKKTQPNDE